MINAAYGSVSDVEILWVLIALVGLVYSILNILDAREDKEYLDAHNIQNGRRALAKYQLIAEYLRAAIQFIFLAIGAAAMSIPELPNSIHLPTRDLIIRTLLTYGLITASIMLTIKSYLGYRVRVILTRGSR